MVHCANAWRTDLRVSPSFRHTAQINPCRLKNGNRTIPPSNGGRILRISELGRFGETTLPFYQWTDIRT